MPGLRFYFQGSYPVSKKQFGIFAIFTSAYFLSYFFRSANAVIAPDLSTEMGLDAAQLGLMTSLFFATFALAQIPLGVGLDRWGPRWVTSGLMLFGALGSLIFALAPSLGALALGRALIGVGMAGVLMGSLKAFSRWLTYTRFSGHNVKPLKPHNWLGFDSPERNGSGCDCRRPRCIQKCRVWLHPGRRRVGGIPVQF